MCGGSSPPPPPDYTAEKAAFAADHAQQRQAIADRYNTSVSQYNDQVRSIGSQIGGLSNQLSGLGVADFTDGTYSNFRSQLGDVGGNLSSLSSPGNQPSFPSTVQSPYGAVSVSIPQYESPIAAAPLRDQYQNLSSQLNSLRDERRREEQSVRNFRSSLLGDANAFGTTLNQLDISNQTGINQAERDLAGLRSRASSFSSPIVDQLYPEGFSRFDSLASDYSNQINDLRQQRSAEQQRISNFESGLYDTADQYRDQINDLTIADADQINSLNQSIQDQLRQANRFDSSLNYDFSNELSEVQGLSSRINELQQQREAEQQRIAQTQSQLDNLARSARSAAGNTGIYSAAGIDAIEDQLSAIRGDVSGFDTPLEADFSGVQSTLSEADAALAQLRERRSDALGGIASQVAPATQGLSDVELYNESAFRDRQSQLSDVENELARFSGGQVSDINAQITEARSQIDSRLQELAEYRSGVEQQAQELLNRVQEASYYGTPDLGGDRESLESLQAEAELYNAQQALDEIDSVANRLNSERQRLEADAEAVAARDKAAQDRLQSQLGSSGVPQFQNFAVVDPLTTSQFAQRFIAPQSEDEDQQTNSLANRGFSSALGVIRA
jgi:chromosome segregation ATPase